jgi:hypothetical protein
MEDEGELALCNYYRFCSRSSLFFAVYLTTVSSLDNVAYNNVDIKKQWIIKDMEERDRGLI